MTGNLETCKNCRWWWPNKDARNRNYRMKWLDENPGRESHWDCDNPELNACIDEGRIPDGMSHYEEIYTGPDFGCIHWEAKLPL